MLIASCLRIPIGGNDVAVPKDKQAAEAGPPAEDSKGGVGVASITRPSRLLPSYVARSSVAASTDIFLYSRSKLLNI
jgi:hypothetical protein